MNLKPKDTFQDRRSEQDRRSTDKSLWAKNVERRKRPDRRMEGLEVDVFTVSEEEFSDMFGSYII
ncbi:MAG: hypothetical protein AB8B89_02745 [Gammaproteobacteria bacterium]